MATRSSNPNLDRLAAEGIDFTHAFCPSPICSPARASLLTGQWPVQHGLLFTEIAEAYHPMMSNRPTFSMLLHEAGYTLGYVGKWHVDEVATPIAFGFHDYVPEDAYTEWRARHGLQPRAYRNGWFGETDPAITPEQSRLAWAARDAASDPPGGSQRPTVLHPLGPERPHLPNIVPEPFASLYPPEQIPPWPSFGDPLFGKPTIQRTQLHNWGVEDWSWAQWAPIVSRYLGEIRSSTGRSACCWPSWMRWGWRRTPRGLYYRPRRYVRGARHDGQALRDVRRRCARAADHALVRHDTCRPNEQAFVSSAIDLASTFCDAAGVPVPETFMGESLLPLATQGLGHNTRQDIFSSYHGNQFGLYSQRMVRDQRWKYIWNPTAEDELYDLAATRAELHNRADDLEATPELNRLRERMVCWLQRTGDPLLNAWTQRQRGRGASVDGFLAGRMSTGCSADFDAMADAWRTMPVQSAASPRLVCEAALPWGHMTSCSAVTNIRANVLGDQSHIGPPTCALEVNCG